jgi:RNase P/RNase MRP subunit p29
MIEEVMKLTRLPKDLNVFYFTLPDDSIAEIEGYKILSQPVERIKNC